MPELMVFLVLFLKIEARRWKKCLVRVNTARTKLDVEIQLCQFIVYYNIL